jgi:DNA-binding SARP family transcriptional activator
MEAVAGRRLDDPLTLEFRILGPLEVRRGGVAVPLGGPRQRALLALLLTRANTAVPRDRLVDELWPEDPPASAVNVLQTYVSHLRKELSPERLVTRAPGYALLVEPGELDLHRFEELAAEGRDALAGGEPEGAAAALRGALELWRGPALGDVADAAFAAVEAARLEELRLAAHEELLDAELARGRNAELVAELEALVAEHPLRERLHGQLMLALYRSGRQSDALEAYRRTRARLGDELGIAPGPALRELERAILTQDPALDLAGAPRPGSATARNRSVLVVCLAGGRLEAAAGLAAPLARRPPHDLVLVRLAPDGGALAGAAREANAVRAALAGASTSVRAAAFTSDDPAADAVRLAGDGDVTLLLLAGAEPPGGDGTAGRTTARILADAPCDVALVADTPGAPAPGPRAPVVVPFGGAEHEWAAAELGAWLAAAEARPLLLAGTESDPAAGKRDASRLLAGVALLVQQVAGVETRPALVEPGAEGMLGAAAGARAVLLGLPDEWRARGLGTGRAELLRRCAAPVLVVRGGVRPGGLAPPGSVTRFTWTLGGERDPALYSDPQ